MIGPDGQTHIQSERFCYRHLAESESSSSLNVAASFIWDAGSIDFGSVIPGSFEVNYHTASQSGTTHATVAGSRYEEQLVNGVLQTVLVDALDIKDLEHSDDLNQLNRNPEAVQTRSAKHSSHVRVYLPVADVVDIWGSFKEAFARGDKESFDQQFDACIRPENVVCDTMIDRESASGFVDEGVIDVAATLGEDWEGEAILIKDDNGLAYLLYRGEWNNPLGMDEAGYGWMLLSDHQKDSEGVLNMSFNAETQTHSFDLKSDNGHFVWKQYADDWAAERLRGINFAFAVASRMRVINLQVNAFIAADVLEVFDPQSLIKISYWKGDGRVFGEVGTSRASQYIQLLFKDNDWIILDAKKETGMTHQLDKEGNVLRIGKASGDTLQYTFMKIFSDAYQREVYWLRLQGNEGNPLVSAPGITYNANFYFDLNGRVLPSDIEHDKFPSHEVIANGKVIYEFDEKNGSILQLIDVDLFFPQIKTSIIISDDDYL